MSKRVSLFLAGCVLSLAPVFGFADTSVLSNLLPTFNPANTDQCEPASQASFCDCYAAEMQSHDPLHRPAAKIIQQMKHMHIENACHMGCGKDSQCFSDCVQATNDYINKPCPEQ